jgi:RHS repeat-associated protein
VAGGDTPVARYVDYNLDGDFDEPSEKQFFLTNRRGDVVAVLGSGPNGEGPYSLIARVKYSAYGKPTIVHPMDFDGDGLVGGSLESVQDGNALEEALGHAPYDIDPDGMSSVVDPKLRAWRALANVTGGELPLVDEGDPAWNRWKDDQREAFDAVVATVPQTEKWAERFGNLPLYASYWWDARVGVYHVRHRVLDPESGRWLQRDPIGYAGGSNLYGYIGDVPHFGVDPMGLDAWWIGDAMRAIGLDGLGEFVDNSADGVVEASDLMTGNATADDSKWERQMRDGSTLSDSEISKVKDQLDRMRASEYDQLSDTIEASSVVVAMPLLGGGGLFVDLALGGGAGAAFRAITDPSATKDDYFDSLARGAIMGASYSALRSTLETMQMILNPSAKIQVVHWGGTGQWVMKGRATPGNYLSSGVIQFGRLPLGYTTRTVQAGSLQRASGFWNGVKHYCNNQWIAPIAP